jgi:hypothetical protein
MNHAVPRPMRPKKAGKTVTGKIVTGEEWMRKLDNYDRSQRRRDRKHRDRCVRLPQHCTEIIDNGRKVNLDRLNHLGPVRTEDEVVMLDMKWLEYGERDFAE